MTVLALLSPPVGPVTPAPAVPAPIVVHQPLVQTLIARRADGQVLARVAEPTWTRIPEWGWEEVGGMVCDVPDTDPGAVQLERDDPVRPFDTWETADVELVVLRRGVEIVGGPVTGVKARSGRVTITAATREAYPMHAVGAPAQRRNRMPAGYFDLDPTLARWTVGAGMAAATTTTEGLLYRRDRSLRLRGAAGKTMTTWFDLPTGKHRNDVTVAMPVRVDEGATAYLGVVAYVRHFVAIPGTSMWDLVSETPVLLPSGWAADDWLPLAVTVSQHPDLRNRYAVDLLGGFTRPGFASSTPPAITYGEVEALRHENISARAGWDKATLVAALFALLQTRMGGPWGRQVTPTGELLASSARYFHHDHEQTRMILDDWRDYGTWWVEGRGTLRWGPRGTDSTVVLNAETMPDWELDGDALEAATEVIGMAPSGDGVSREEASASNGSPVLLSRVEQAPWGIGPRDLDGWTERRLDGLSARPTLTGTLHARPGELPGEWLHRLNVADRCRFAFPSGGRVLSGTARPMRMAWDPVTDRPEVRTWEVLDVA